MSLRQTIATPGGKGRFVRGLFATIADRYDLITVLLSYGRDRSWKRRLTRMAGPLAGVRALDLACGTGDIAMALAERGAAVVGVDLTPRMIELAVAKDRSRRSTRRPVHFIVGDMCALPLAGGTFDLVTTGYGLRNVPNLPAAIREIRRVLRPGGRVLSLDFNRPASRVVLAAYIAYLTVVGSALGWLLHRDPDTYRYIPESIRIYPGASGVVRLFQSEGFVAVRWHRVLGGLMAIHEARLPG
jgi:demethylmenaquinone methyltransferase/2-methoxy-6-polyprenyl-1,4-benzoquinol methylase